MNELLGVCTFLNSELRQRREEQGRGMREKDAEGIHRVCGREERKEGKLEKKEGRGWKGRSGNAAEVGRRAVTSSGRGSSSHCGSGSGRD